MSISIARVNGYYDFYAEGDFVSSCCYSCVKCDMQLSAIYSHIIKKLTEANLLPEDHKVICCQCDRAEGIIRRNICMKCGDKLEYSRMGEHPYSNYIFRCESLACDYNFIRTL